MNRFLGIMVVATAIGLIPQTPSAAPLDGSAPIVCASSEVRECEIGGQCLRLLPEHVNRPTLIHVDTAKKMLTGLGPDKRTAPIHEIERRDGRLVMYGGQEGRGWTVVIVAATGRLSASVVDDGFSFAIFGACAEP